MFTGTFSIIVTMILISLITLTIVLFYLKPYKDKRMDNYLAIIMIILGIISLTLSFLSF